MGGGIEKGGWWVGVGRGRRGEEVGVEMVGL